MFDRNHLDRAWRFRLANPLVRLRRYPIGSQLLRAKKTVIYLPDLLNPNQAGRGRVLVDG